LYLDDLLTGAETIEDAREIRDEIIALLARGGFSIRQWASNDMRIVDGLADNVLHAHIILNKVYSLKTLGITWSIHDDKICYSAYTVKGTGKLTKQIILSEITNIFDPLGLLGSIVFYAKKMMQDVWRCKIHWNDVGSTEYLYGMVRIYSSIRIHESSFLRPKITSGKILQDSNTRFL